MRWCRQLLSCFSGSQRLHAAISTGGRVKHAQVDPAGSNITLATLCGYDCSRIYPGNSLLLMNSTTERVGSVTILANNEIPNPLAIGTKSSTFPNVNLDTTTYINVTVNCWPASFSVLVHWLARICCTRGALHAWDQVCMQHGTAHLGPFSMDSGLHAWSQACLQQRMVH